MQSERKWNGYMTVEASLLVPMVLFLCLFLILVCFFLYNRCIISQNNYIDALRESRSVYRNSEMIEVIYGEMGEREPVVMITQSKRWALEVKKVTQCENIIKVVRGVRSGK